MSVHSPCFLAMSRPCIGTGSITKLSQRRARRIDAIPHSRNTPYISAPTWGLSAIARFLPARERWAQITCPARARPQGPHAPPSRSASARHNCCSTPQSPRRTSAVPRARPVGIRRARGRDHIWDTRTRTAFDRSLASFPQGIASGLLRPLVAGQVRRVRRGRDLDGAVDTLVEIRSRRSDTDARAEEIRP